MNHWLYLYRSIYNWPSLHVYSARKLSKVIAWHIFSNYYVVLTGILQQTKKWRCRNSLYYRSTPKTTVLQKSI